MNSLTIHIEYLLRHHSCVIMPRLGAFIATERCAAVNEEWGSISAPIKEICFNSAIINNDGLLATSISRREQISYEAACSKMEKLIEDIKQQLDTQAEVRIGNIGSLHCLPDGRLRFEPTLSATKQSEIIGYTPVCLPAKDAEMRNAIVADNTFYNFRVSKRLVKGVASLALPLVASLSILLWVLSLGNGTATVNPSERIDYASVLPLPESSQTPKVENRIETRDIESQPEGMIVVAVFQTEEKAIIFAHQHTSSPYTISVERYKNLWYVTAGEKGSRDELNHRLKTKDFVSEYPDAWILMK